MYNPKIARLYTKGGERAEHLPETLYNSSGQRMGHRPKTTDKNKQGEEVALMRIGDPATQVTRDMWINTKNLTVKREAP